MSSIKELFFFGVVGGTAFLTHLSIVWLLVNFTAIPLLIANALAFTTAFFVSLFGHSKLTFQSDKSIKKIAAPFFIGAVLSLLINEYFVALFNSRFEYSAMISVTMATFFSSLFFYLYNKFFIFVKKPS